MARIPEKVAVRTGDHLAIGAYAHIKGQVIGAYAPIGKAFAMDPRTRMLLEAPVGPTILRLALPNVAVMVVQASIGLIESYFISKLVLDALTGVALVFPLFMLLQMVSAGAMGGGILSAVARSLGSGNRQRANELVW